MCTVRDNARSTHCPGASSDAAVRNIEQNNTRNMGCASSLNISPVETPPPSVRWWEGNFIPYAHQHHRSGRNQNGKLQLCLPVHTQMRHRDTEQAADDGDRPATMHEDDSV